MQTFLAVLATLAFSGCAVVVVVHRVVRSARRRMSALRDRAQLVARAHGVGPLAEVARLRRDMDRSLSGARRALAAARAVDAPVGDVPSLLARLELSARDVDAELRMVQSQPDNGRVPRQLALARSRAAAISESAACLVDGLMHAAGHDADELAALQAACEIEADAMRATRGTGGGLTDAQVARLPDRARPPGRRR